MRRMQVVIEEWQYQLLRTIAERQGKSASAVLREIITDRLTEAGGDDPLHKVAGIAQAPVEKGLSSTTIDERLYKA